MEPGAGKGARLPGAAEDEETNGDYFGEGNRMKERDADLDRLLRSAATASGALMPEAPYGFETRVLASWRAGLGRATEAAELTNFLRRIGVVAMAVLALASAGAYLQFNENEARTIPQTNEYAIADTAIQTEFSQ
jgi:hypothetical protein